MILGCQVSERLRKWDGWVAKSLRAQRVCVAWRREEFSLSLYEGVTLPVYLHQFIIITKAMMMLSRQWLWLMVVVKGFLLLLLVFHHHSVVRKLYDKCVCLENVTC